MCLCACPTIAPPIKLDPGCCYFRRAEAESAKLQFRSKGVKLCSEDVGGIVSSHNDD